MRKWATVVAGVWVIRVAHRARRSWAAGGGRIRVAGVSPGSSRIRTGGRLAVGGGVSGMSGGGDDAVADEPGLGQEFFQWRHDVGPSVSGGKMISR